MESEMYVPGTGQKRQFFTTRALSEAFLELAFHGELDAATAPDLVAELADIDHQNIRIDLSHLDFLDSSGLTALISTYNELAAQGHHLVLINPKRQARMVFEITGLADLFNIDDDVNAKRTLPGSR